MILLKRFSFLLKPSGDMQIFRGIRTFLAIAFPLILGQIIHRPEIGLGIGLTTQALFLADVGGLYSVRAKTLIGTTLGIVLAITLGTLLSGSLWLAVLLVFSGLFMAGYLAVYDENGAASGLAIGLTLLFAITLPPGGLVLAIERSLVVLLGGAWATFVALLVWPFLPNQPLRQIVADNFEGIAKYLEDINFRYTSSENDVSSLALLQKLLLESRETLAYTKMGSWGRSNLRELLVVLIEDSDNILITLIAIQELLILHPLPQLQTVEFLLEDAIEQVASITRDIAQLILGRTKLPDCNRLKLLLTAIEQQQDLQQRALDTGVDDYTIYVTVTHLKNLLKKLQIQLQLATQTAQQLHRGDSVPTHRKHHISGKKAPLQRIPIDEDQWMMELKPWWEPLQENFNLESPFFRHALRWGLGSAIGVLIYVFLRIPHGLWVGFTIIIVLKPDFSLTFQRFFNRIIGTLLGAVVVTLILEIVHDPFWLQVIGVLCISIAFSLLRFHYSLAVFFITLYALTFSQIHLINSHENEVAARAICTLIGATVAFVLSFSFLRPKEELLFSSAAVKAIETVNLYFQSVMGVYLGNSPYQPAKLMQVRNQVRLANVNIETAIQRLLNDPSTLFTSMEPAIIVANYIPLLGRGVSVILIQLEQYSGSDPHPTVILLTQQVVETLTQLAQSLQNNTLPPPLPILEETVEDILSHIQELRVERLAEIANNQNSTITHNYLRDYHIVASTLVEIVLRIRTIHSALSRFELAASPKD